MYYDGYMHDPTYAYPDDPTYDPTDEEPTLDEKVDSLIAQSDGTRDDMQTVIDDQIFFRYNTVNLIIGKRGSGKTYSTMREILKLLILMKDENKYSQIHYITDKVRDDTVDMFKPAFQKLGFFFNWVSTSNAEPIINTITMLKSWISDPDWIDENPDDYEIVCQVLNCQPHSKTIPHTIMIFDDCIGLFNKATSLSKKLFENRQSRITYFLLLQDVQGLSPSMKANIDSLTLFGGFPKHKFQTLFYQLPPVDLTYETYSELNVEDAVRIDYIESSVKILIRNKR